MPSVLCYSGGYVHAFCLVLFRRVSSCLLSCVIQEGEFMLFVLCYSGG